VGRPDVSHSAGRDCCRCRPIRRVRPMFRSAKGVLMTQLRQLLNTAMSLLERTLNDDNESNQGVLRPNDVLFRTEKRRFCSRLLEGRYPPYRDIIPKKPLVKIALPVDGLLSAVSSSRDHGGRREQTGPFWFRARQTDAPGLYGAAIGSSKVELNIGVFRLTHQHQLRSEFRDRHAQGPRSGETIYLDLVERSKASAVPGPGTIINIW